MARIRYLAFWLMALLMAVFALQQFTGRWAWQVGAVEWQFLGSLFAHGSITHLLTNLVALMLFGGMLEGQLGTKRLAIVLIAAGIMGNLAGIGSYDRVIGASGAIYGAIGALVAIRPTMIIWFEFMPMPMLLAGIAYAIVDIVGALAGTTGTGHLAHLAGLGAGLILGLAWRKDAPPPKRRRKGRISKDEKRQIDQRLDHWERRYMPKE